MVSSSSIPSTLCIFEKFSPIPRIFEKFSPIPYTFQDVHYNVIQNIYEYRGKYFDASTLEEIEYEENIELPSYISTFTPSEESSYPPGFQPFSEFELSNYYRDVAFSYQAYYNPPRGYYYYKGRIFDAKTVKIVKYDSNRLLKERRALNENYDNSNVEDIMKSFGIESDIKEFLIDNTNMALVLLSTVINIPVGVFSKFAYVSVEIDENNPKYYVSKNSIIEKTSNKLITTFGVVDMIYKLPDDINFIGKESLNVGTQTIYQDIEGNEFFNDMQFRILRIPKSVKDFDGNNQIDNLRSVCYDGKYYHKTLNFGARGTNYYVSRKYIYPNWNNNLRNPSCAYYLIDNDKVRHHIGITGSEIGLTVAVIIISLVLVAAIIIYFLHPFRKLNN